MNHETDDTALDQILHQWADERAADPEHLDILQKRIVSTLELEHRHLPASRPRPAMPPIVSRHSVASRFPVGLAAVVLVALVWFAQVAGESILNHQLAGEDGSLPPDSVWLNQGQLDGQAVLLTEMEQLFGDRLNWLAETGERVELGLDEVTDSVGSAANDTASSPIAIRMVVEKREAGDKSWKSAWTIDVVSRSEELVEMTPQSSDDVSVMLWAYALPDGTIAVDSELAWRHQNDEVLANSSSPVRTTISNVQQDGQPSEAFVSEADGVEYRVFQTAAVLDGKVG